jgi:hypothetical protein
VAGDEGKFDAVMIAMTSEMIKNKRPDGGNNNNNIVVI